MKENKIVGKHDDRDICKLVISGNKKSRFFTLSKLKVPNFALSKQFKFLAKENKWSAQSFLCAMLLFVCLCSFSRFEHDKTCLFSKIKVFARNAEIPPEITANYYSLTKQRSQQLKTYCNYSFVGFYAERVEMFDTNLKILIKELNLNKFK